MAGQSAPQPRCPIIPSLDNSMGLMCLRYGTASVQQPPPPPPPATLSSGKQHPLPPHRSPPCPQHAALPIPPEYPPVQETSGSSQANISENGSAPPMQNGLQFPPSQDSTGPELSDGDEEKKHLPVQETDPAPQALSQQTSGSRVPDEADAQAGENGEERLPLGASVTC